MTMRRLVYTVYALLLAAIAVLCLADAYLALAEPSAAADAPGAGSSILDIVGLLTQVNPYLATLIVLVIVLLRSQRVRERAFLGHLAAEAKANRKERSETLEVLRDLTSSVHTLGSDVRGALRVEALRLETRAPAGDPPSRSLAGNGQS